jgi:hypothetical protein
MSEYYYNENYFTQIDTEEKAYWLGFLYADGYIEPIYRKQKIKAMRAVIGLQEADRNHLEKFLIHIESNAPITQNITILNHKNYYSNRVRINNTKMCKDLIKLGCVNNKSLILKFPNDDIIPKHLIRHFIRGYFDGDGCVYYKEGEKIDNRNKKKYKYKRLMVSIVGTESFLNSLIDVFKQHNINFKFDYSSNCGKAFEKTL